MSDFTNVKPPFHFDGFGINDANGERIAKVCLDGPYIGGSQRDADYDALSNLMAASARMQEAISIMLDLLQIHNPVTGFDYAANHHIVPFCELLRNAFTLSRGIDVQHLYERRLAECKAEIERRKANPTTD